MEGASVVRSRKRNGKRAPATRFAFDGDGPAMRGRDKLHDAQAETAASACAREALIDLIERLKDFFAFARRNANAVVLHRKNHSAILRARVEEDVLGLFGVLVGVFEDVNQR